MLTSQTDMWYLTPEQSRAFTEGLRQTSDAVCANEAYNKSVSAEDRDQPRFISCPCPKCSPQCL